MAKRLFARTAKDFITELKWSWVNKTHVTEAVMSYEDLHALLEDWYGEKFSPSIVEIEGKFEIAGVTLRPVGIPPSERVST